MVQLEGGLANPTGSSSPKISCRGVSCWAECPDPGSPPCPVISGASWKGVASAQTLWPVERALRWEAVRDCSPSGRHLPTATTCFSLFI